MSIFRLFKETNSKEVKESEEKTIPEVKLKPLESAKTSETSSQKLSETSYNKTIENVIGEFGCYMPEEQRVRIDIESENHKPEVMSEEAYMKKFPETDPAVLGHYNMEGGVVLKDGSSEVINHVTTHEAMHLTSFNETNDTNPFRVEQQSGIRETIYNAHGIIEDKNQALNEGITELYAEREMYKRGEVGAIEAVNAYPEATVKAYELQGIVGDDVIQEAYFGGKTDLLKSEVNRLSYNDETAWDRYSRNVDILEYSCDEQEVQDARWRLTVQNAVMHSFQEVEAHAEIDSKL